MAVEAANGDLLHVVVLLGAAVVGMASAFTVVF